MIDPVTQLPAGTMTILRAEVGSTVHGTNVSDQGDRDEMAIAIEPMHYVIGMRHWETSVQRTAPEGMKSGPGDLDLVTHSLRKFCRLASKGNPTMQLPLWVPESAIVEANELGRELIAKRSMFLSRECGKAFLGYMTQKFQRGDLVHVAKDLGPMMSHFTSDVDAIVIGSYQDQYGGADTADYTLHLKGHGECSWYHESQLELIERNRPDLLEEWQATRDAEAKQKSNLDWIFANGPDVLKETHGASIAALARGVGITNLWGSHGEGLAYYENAMRVLSLASPFLQSKDKDGWLAFCQEVKLPTIDYKIT